MNSALLTSNGTLQRLTSTERSERLGKLITFLQESSGLGLRSLARRLDITGGTLLRWKNGHGNPEAFNLRKIAAFSSRSVNDLEAYLEGRVDLESYLNGTVKSRLSLSQVLRSLSHYELDELNAILKNTSEQITVKSSKILDLKINSSEEIKEDWDSIQFLRKMNQQFTDSEQNYSHSTSNSNSTRLQLTEHQALRLASAFTQSLLTHQANGISELELSRKHEVPLEVFSDIKSGELNIQYHYPTLEKVAALCFHIVAWDGMVCALDISKTYDKDLIGFLNALCDRPSLFTT